MRGAMVVGLCLALVGTSFAATNQELEARVGELEHLITKLQQRAEKDGKNILKVETAPARRMSGETDFLWILICGALVMVMQPGFAMLEAGAVRSKSAVTVLFKNMIDVCFGTLMWFFIGCGFAYGTEPGVDESNKFAGWDSYFFGRYMIMDMEGGEDIDYSLAAQGLNLNWFFQWAFCATAATIVSGGVAERIKLPAYILYSCLMTGIIYPVVVYWTWSGNGWLTLFWGEDSDKTGYSDFAGSGIVHLCGGIAALVGAILCGPRPDRFTTPEKYEAHNTGLLVLGTFILWFGWYGFNCGSTLTFSEGDSVKGWGGAGQAAHVAVNTTIAAASGGIMVFMLRLRTKKYDLGGMCNGILAGLVCVCAGVGSFYPSVCIVVGFLGGIAYELAAILENLLKIDDPIQAFPVHGAAGFMGCILAALFGAGGPDGDMLIANIVGALVIAAWSGGLTLLILLPFKLTKTLVYTEEEMNAGSDTHMSPNKMYTDDKNETKV